MPSLVISDTAVQIQSDLSSYQSQQVLNIEQALEQSNTFVMSASCSAYATLVNKSVKIVNSIFSLIVKPFLSNYLFQNFIFSKKSLV